MCFRRSLNACRCAWGKFHIPQRKRLSPGISDYESVADRFPIECQSGGDGLTTCQSGGLASSWAEYTFKTGEGGPSLLLEKTGCRSVSYHVTNTLTLLLTPRHVLDDPTRLTTFRWHGDTICRGSVTGVNETWEAVNVGGVGDLLEFIFEVNRGFFFCNTRGKTVLPLVRHGSWCASLSRPHTSLCFNFRDHV